MLFPEVPSLLPWQSSNNSSGSIEAAEADATKLTNKAINLFCKATIEYTVLWEEGSLRKMEPNKALFN